eukprot:m.574596 g.574596  ORF g.574596 m.574596 type:complete len:509 (+) comp22281_c0_seq2:192-1718(+)
MSSDGDEQNRRRHLYKTQLCRDFMSGECHRADQCHFAHGKHELQPKNPSRVPKITFRGRRPNRSMNSEQDATMMQHNSGVPTASAHGHMYTDPSDPSDAGSEFRTQYPHLMKFTAAVAQIRFERTNTTANIGDMEELTGTQFELNRTKDGSYILRFKAVERKLEYQTARVDKLDRVLEEDCSTAWENLLASTTKDVQRLKELYDDVIRIIEAAPAEYKRRPPYLQPMLTRYNRRRTAPHGPPPPHLLQARPKPGVVAPVYGLQEGGAVGGGGLTAGVVPPVSAASGMDVQNPFAALALDEDDPEEDALELEEAPLPSRDFCFFDPDTPIATTGQLRYFDCLVACALAEAYQLSAGRLSGARKWIDMARTFVMAYHTVNNLFHREDYSSMVAVQLQAETGDITGTELDGHCLPLLNKVVQNITLVRNHLAEAKDDAIRKCLQKQEHVNQKLLPKVHDRNAARQKYEQQGRRWTDNPTPKNDYAERRRALEKEARELDAALTLLVPLELQ